MNIITLIDNLTYGKNLIGEHGFSVFIDNENEKILFDTGQSGNFIYNAIKLGIDLSEINFVIISHGHYDHIGGLMEFVKCNKKAKIYIKKEAFYNKYKVKEFIGVPFNASLIEKRIIYTDNFVNISDRITLVSKIKIYDEIDTHFEDMIVEKDGKFMQDEFDDEQFLIIKKNSSIIIISGCSHRGISNIVKNALDIYNLPIDYLIGGFHLMNEDKIKVENTIKLLNTFPIKNIGISHCSGIESLSLIKNITKANVFYNYTGNVIEI